MKENERKSCFPMSLKPSLSSRDRNNNGGIWFMLHTKRSILVDKLIASQEQREHPLKKLINRLHIPPRSLLPHEDDDDVRETSEKTIFNRFYFTVCDLMLTAYLLSSSLIFSVHNNVPEFKRLASNDCCVGTSNGEGLVGLPLFFLG